MTAPSARAGTVVRHAARIGFSEFRSDYTLSSWLLGWMVRLVFQVLFFSLIGRVVGGPDVVRYLVIGNAVAVGALEASVVIVSLVRDRYYGSLPFLLAAPGRQVVAMLSRNLNWPFNGLLSSVVALVVSSVLLGVQLPAAGLLQAVPVILVCTVSTYCFGCWVAVVVLWHPGLSLAALNITYLSLMVFTGVNVPISAWPAPVEWVVQVLPVTHGLTAVRRVLDGAGLTDVLGAVGVELSVACGWLAVAAVLAHWLSERARRNGTVELGG